MRGKTELSRTSTSDAMTHGEAQSGNAQIFQFEPDRARQGWDNADEETDVWAVSRGMVSVTALNAAFEGAGSAGGSLRELETFDLDASTA